MNAWVAVLVPVQSPLIGIAISAWVAESGCEKQRHGELIDAGLLPLSAFRAKVSRYAVVAPISRSAR